MSITFCSMLVRLMEAAARACMSLPLIGAGRGMFHLFVGSLLSFQILRLSCLCFLSVPLPPCSPGRCTTSGSTSFVAAAE